MRQTYESIAANLCAKAQLSGLNCQVIQSTSDEPYNDTSTNMLSNTKSCGRVKTGFPWSLVTAKPRFYVGKFGRCTQVTL